MIDFPIHRFRPRLIDLRLYVYQMANDHFGLSDDLADLIRERCGELSAYAIDSLDEEALRQILGDRLPDTLFVFSTSAAEQHPLLRDLASEHTLYDLLFKSDFFEDSPVLYTGIQQVSFDRDGMVVMISYMDQIYTLCRRDGKPLTGHCHDLDIGMQGRVLSRSSSDPIWEYHLYDGHLMNEMETGALGVEWEFPDIRDRDVIPQMFEDPSEFAQYYPDLHPGDAQATALFLHNDPHAWRVLDAYYHDEPDLAIEAVNANLVAYTKLSRRLRDDRDFTLSLLDSLEEPGRLYPYLKDALQRDREIVDKCYLYCPGALRRIGVIHDREVFRRLFREALRFDSSSYLELADASIRADRDFILELASYDWEVILHSTPEIYTDIHFVEQVVSRYLVAEAERRPSGWEGDDLPF
ncbi:MAG: hypothetical protein EBZ67_02035 [Chitinophagia bacterium]|nr:hypothetical protein [Chitinophagia bacterium]